MTVDDLKKYDFIFLLDKSGSMSTQDCPGGKSRWQYAQESALALARKCMEFDSDGITVIPFANNFKVYNNVTDGDGKIAQIFKENEPMGGTDTAKVIEYVLNQYFSNRSKPIVVICVTDGEPSDQQALARVIVNATKKMKTDEEVGISFIQVGTDKRAQAALKQLDDDLVSQGAKFDIVDTKTMDEIEEMPLADVLIQALTD